MSTGIKPISITTETTSDRGLVDLLEAELDVTQIEVIHSDLILRSITPIDLIVAAASGYFVDKFILEPFLGPVAERWKKWVQALPPIQELTVSIREASRPTLLKVNLHDNHQQNAELWTYLGEAVQLLLSSSFPGHIDEIHILLDTNSPRGVAAFGYSHGTAEVELDLQVNALKPLESGRKALAEPPDLSPDEILNRSLERSKRYWEWVDEQRQFNLEE